MSNQAAAAYAEPRLLGSVWLAGDGLTSACEAPPAKAARQAAYEIDPGVLQLAATLPSTERFSLKPPAPPAATGAVDERTAEAALRDVLSALRAADQACGQLRGDGADEDKTAPALQPTIKTLSKITASLLDFYGAAISMETLQLRLYEVQSSGIFDLMSLSLSNQKMLRDVEACLVRKKVDAENLARDEQAKLNEKAGKGGILSLVCNWAMAAAQLVSGVVKLLTGQYVGGVAEIGAAVSGFTKSILMTIVHCHPELKEQLQDDIDRAAEAELALGVISSASSLFSATRVVKASKFIVKATVDLVKGENNTLGVTLSRAINMADDAAQVAKNAAPAAAKVALRESEMAMAAAQQIATNVGKEIARNTAEQMQAVLKLMFKDHVPRLTEHLTKILGEEAIEKMVSESLMRAAKTVARKGYGDAVSLVKEEFAKQVEREMMRALCRAAMSQQALVNAATTLVSVGTTVAIPIVNGSMTIEFASKQREINRLLLDAIVFGFLIDNMRRAVKQEEEFRENLMDDLQALTTSTTKGVREAAECMQQVVGNMA